MSGGYRTDSWNKRLALIRTAQCIVRESYLKSIKDNSTILDAQHKKRIGLFESVGYSIATSKRETQQKIDRFFNEDTFLKIKWGPILYSTQIRALYGIYCY